MKLKDIIYLLALIIGLISVWVYVLVNEKKIAYVNTLELYDGFEMKKELEQTFVKVQGGRKQQLDSLELELRLLNAQIESSKSNTNVVNIFEIKRDSYLQKKQQFEEDNGLMQEQYNKNIRKQLNQYVADYGKKNNYNYLLGADGSGTLMYGKETADITKEVLDYINNKYRGIK